MRAPAAGSLAGLIALVAVSGSYARAASDRGDVAGRGASREVITVQPSATELGRTIEQQRPAANDRRHGRVRGEGRVFVDDDGPFLARGASLFWALWGYQHDRERLARNLATLGEWGFHYIRVLGQVGAPDDRPGPVCPTGTTNCDTWKDRRVNPNAEGYWENVAGLTDWAYREFGLRVQWTIFGAVEFTPTPERRRALVQRFADMGRGREQALFAFEIANEGSRDGFPGESGRQELQALGRLLMNRSDVLVALSSPPQSRCEGETGIEALYGEGMAEVATLHFRRLSPEEVANWELVNEPWAFRSCQGIPLLASSNEPIGPESSVASLEDPDQIAALALVTYGSGVGAFVLHSGPGIRGGGAADRARGRHANLWELPTGSRIAATLETLGRLLPPDLPNWEKQRGDSAEATRAFDVTPSEAGARLYCFARENRMICAALGLGRAVRVTARRAMTVTIHEPVSGRAIASHQLAMKQRLPLAQSPLALLLQLRYE